MRNPVAAARGGGQDREVFRSVGAAVLWWIWVVLAVLLLIDLAAQGRGRSSLVAALVVVAITGVAYAIAWRPRVVADAGGILVVNPLRDHRLPWLAVDQIDAVTALRIRCLPGPAAKRGKVVTSWAVQSSPRAAARREFAERRSARRVGRAPFAGFGQTTMPSATREAMSRTPADHAVQALALRLQMARQAAAGASAGGAPSPAAGEDAESQALSPSVAGASGEASDARPAAPQPVAHWSWAAISAMAVPVIAIVAVLLA